MPEAGGDDGLVGGGLGVEVGIDRVRGERREELDGFAAVETFCGAFEGVEAGEGGRIDGPEFAGDADGVVGCGDHAGVFAEMVKTIAGNGAGFAEEVLVGEDVVVGAAVFEGAVNEDEMAGGGGHGGIRR